MAKVSIANYLTGNLSNRFPISQNGIIDHDIIEIMVDGWQNNHYPILGFNIRQEPQKAPRKRLLM